VARNRNRKGQAIKISLNGKAAQNAYALSDEVGRFVGRVDVAKKRAAAGLVRRAGPAVSREIRRWFNVRAGQLSGKITAKDTGDSLRIYAFDRRIPLMAFGGKWAGRNSAGATASILRGKSEIYPQSFIRTIQGLRSIRVRQARGSGRAPRGPVQILYGPSPREMITGRKSDPETRSDLGFYAPRVRDNVTAELVTYYVGEFKRLMDLGIGRG
jgi:hypothetical protein